MHHLKGMRPHATVLALPPRDEAAERRQRPLILLVLAGLAHCAVKGVDCRTEPDITLMQANWAVSACKSPCNPSATCHSQTHLIKVAWFQLEARFIFLRHRNSLAGRVPRPAVDPLLTVGAFRRRKMGGALEWDADEHKARCAVVRQMGPESCASACRCRRHPAGLQPPPLPESPSACREKRIAERRARVQERLRLQQQQRAKQGG